MYESTVEPPEGYHYRGMVPPSINSKLCSYISEQMQDLEWKIRYSHLFTYNTEDVKDVNGKKIPSVCCTVCNKKFSQFFQVDGRTISLSNFQKHVKEVHITELSAIDQTKKEVVV